MASAGVSPEEQAQINEAIRVSKEQWLAEAAEERRRRLSSVPVSPPDDCIDLCSSSDEECAAPTAASVASGGGALAGIKPEPAQHVKAELLSKKRQLQNSKGDAVDDDCYVVPPVAKRPTTTGTAAAASASSGAAAAATGDSSADGDDDVTVEGTSGAMSLIDFPHARENCGKHRFELGKYGALCANCYCYVCDVPASDCLTWAAHCSASHSEPRWRKEREHQRTARSSAAAALPPPVVVAAAAAPIAAAAAPARARRAEAAWSCDRVMREVQQVYPVEVAEPHSAGLLPSVRLRPYQKQSLAFMLDRERGRDAATAGYQRRYGLTGAAYAAYEMDAYDASYDGCMIRGGWLSDEMGMGKTMVCISLILANPAAASSFRKATLVVAPVSLLGQWSDEIRRYAPNLRVAMITSQSKDTAVGADVVLTTHNTLIKRINQEMIDRDSYHRVIVDEVHTLPRVDSRTTRQIGQMTTRTPNVWLVTGTPLSRGADDLSTGNMLLGNMLLRKFGTQALSVGPELIDALRQLMIRHTKGQVIGGTTALTLPSAAVETVWLEMSADERALYEASKQDRLGPKQKAVINGVNARSLEITLTLQRNACANVYWRSHDPGTKWSIPLEIFTDFGPLSRLASNADHHYGWRRTGTPLPILSRCTKLRALCEDVRTLVQAEPDAHAVVFTHSRAAHVAVTKLMQQEPGITTLEFSGSTGAGKRHEAIRDFQAAVAAGPQGIRGRGAKVFVITVKTGAVGITLTAASRVYLLEPALDPRTELQAAGRIHRLGQTKQVHIKRFAFRGTCEEEIIGLHRELEAGRVEVVDGVLPPVAVQRIMRQ
jgi:hypothetical protein